MPALNTKGEKRLELLGKVNPQPPIQPVSERFAALEEQ
jgi:hypothetical protein